MEATIVMMLFEEGLSEGPSRVTLSLQNLSQTGHPTFRFFPLKDLGILLFPWELLTLMASLHPGSLPPVTCYFEAREGQEASQESSSDMY